MDALADATSAHGAFQPPKRVSVSRGAHESLYIRQPGGYTGPWSYTETPYMVEPMDMMASRKHEAVCFVGPARTGKTLGLLDGFLAYAITCDPGDTLVVQMTQDKARDYSKTRIDRMLRYSPSLHALKSSRSNDDNTFDKQFKHGMFVKIGWPTVTQLSGSDYRYVMLTDYDRMPDDVDGEGAAYGLALKRTQTFLSRGMCMVESSPGREVIDPNWQPVTAHEAPPTGGILGIYNRSDRRRWYWPCPDCGEFFEAKPGLELFNLPNELELIETCREMDLDRFASEHSHIHCPHCGVRITSKSKHDMNLAGLWVAEGQSIEEGRVVGTPIRANVAGYWLGGVAAAYQSWHSLVLRYLQGLREYALSGMETTLQTTTNTDQGMPYMSRVIAYASRVSGGPESRKEAGLERFIVPDEARYLVAAVDVQGGQTGRFVVQVHAIGQHMEQWVIDRFAITESDRMGIDGGKAPIDPASYPEDWDLLTKLVINSTYRLTADGREMRIRMVACDTGGEDGVTDKAYDWFRRLRRDGLHGRVMLVKGASAKGAPLIKESWVGSKRAGDRGDVPLYLLNPNMLKDAVSASLKRPNPGPGYIHFGGWTPHAFFEELVSSEVREANGTWRKVKRRNEALDLACYIRAAAMKLGGDRINWDHPPSWAAPLDTNIDVITRDDRIKLQEGTNNAVVRRRSTRSSYLTG